MHSYLNTECSISVSIYSLHWQVLCMTEVNKNHLKLTAVGLQFWPRYPPVSWCRQWHRGDSRNWIWNCSRWIRCFDQWSVVIHFVLLGKYYHSYETSLAIWDHTVLPAIWHKWTCLSLTPAMQAGTRFTYPGGMEGWVDLGDLIAPRPGVEPATFRSRVRCRTTVWYYVIYYLKRLSGFVSECKLDCFGMAVCVIAACQVLQLDDVHLALSEDHAWAVFNDLQESVEITWHGNIFTASIALNCQ